MNDLATPGVRTMLVSKLRRPAEIFQGYGRNLSSLVVARKGTAPKMPRFVLHIGAGKTGSSSIQNFLKVNAGGLLGHGYFVPGSDLAHGKITGEHVWATQTLMSSENPVQELAHRFSRLDETVPSNKTILISAENLSNLGNAAHYRGTLTSGNSAVILYIRRQDELLTSAWQQWQSKVERDLNAWIIKALLTHGRWDQVLDEWAAVVGTSNITVRLFDKSEFVDGDLIKDYCHCIGLGSNADGIVTQLDAENSSVSDVITDLVTGASGLFKGPHDNHFYRMIDSLTASEFVPTKKVSLISRDMRESILHYYRSANQRVCKEYFQGRGRLFPEVDHSKYEYISRDDLTKKQLQFITRLVFELSKRR